MKWNVYCGMLEWKVVVEAETEEEAVRKGRQEVIERLQDAEFWATKRPESP